MEISVMSVMKYHMRQSSPQSIANKPRVNRTLTVATEGVTKPVRTAKKDQGKKETIVDIVFDKEVVIVYSVDYNINKIHRSIIKHLNGQQTVEKEKTSFELEVERGRARSPQTVNERRKSLKRIEELEKRICYFNEVNEYEEYMTKAYPFVEKYNEMGPIVKTISFTTGRIDDGGNKEKNERRLSIISSYFEVAKRYVPLKHIRLLEYIYSCESCGYPLEGVAIDDNGFRVCPQCQAEHNSPPSSVTGKEVNSQRDDYDNSDNFDKALLHYQCKQKDTTPDQLYDALESWFVSKGYPRGEDIRAMPADDRGKKPGTDLQMLLDALNKTGYNEFYEDYNLIGHRYWGWLIQDVGHLEHQIKEDYSETQGVYKTLDRDRKSSISTQVRLFKHLEMVGHNCRITDFKIPGGEHDDSFRDQMRLWKRMCEGCNNPRIYYMPS